MAGWDGRGSTRAWRRLRVAVLQRDRNRCRIRRPGTCVGTSVPMHVHHLLGKTRGDDPRFVVAACAPCNLAVGNPMKAADPPCTPVTRW